jgi:hypothetical protein
MSETQVTIMIGSDEGDWEKVTLTATALAAEVAAGNLYHCAICDDGTYDDGLKSYHREVR